MPELGDDDRKMLSEIRNRFGHVDLEKRSVIEGGFTPIDPMLAETLEGPIEAVDNGQWVVEPKYDGTRLLVEKFDGEIRAYTRRGIDRYDAIPSVQEDLNALPDDLILDGELTFRTSSGTSTFQPIHTSAEKLASRGVSPVYFVFDILYDDGDCTNHPLLERKRLLDSRLRVGDTLKNTPFLRSGFREYFQKLTEADEEGVVVKRRESRYRVGIRSNEWLKVKRFTELDAIVVGYTAGSGSRSTSFGSLVLSDGTRYIGRVGSGFSEADLETLDSTMNEVDQNPFPESVVGRSYTAVEPFVVSVKYHEITNSGKLRAPVFQGVNWEKPVDDVLTIDT